MTIEHLVSIDLDHREIHILKALLKSVLKGDLQSDEPITLEQYNQLIYKLTEAHDIYAQKVIDSI